MFAVKRCKQYGINTAILLEILVPKEWGKGQICIENTKFMDRETFYSSKMSATPAFLKSKTYFKDQGGTICSVTVT